MSHAERIKKMPILRKMIILYVLCTPIKVLNIKCKVMKNLHIPCNKNKSKYKRI